MLLIGRSLNCLPLEEHCFVPCHAESERGACLPPCNAPGWSGQRGCDSVDKRGQRGSSQLLLVHLATIVEHLSRINKRPTTGLISTYASFLAFELPISFSFPLPPRSLIVAVIVVGLVEDAHFLGYPIPRSLYYSFISLVSASFFQLSPSSLFVSTFTGDRSLIIS